MKIKRTINGVEMEIELTAEEKRKAYEEQHRYYMFEDIKSRYEVDDNEVGAIVSCLDRALGANDSYWESYWLAVEYVCEEFGCKERED